MAKVKLDKELYEKACEFAEKNGYTSVDEFVIHIVEKSVSEEEAYTEDEAEKVKKRLQGLGYVA